MYSTAKPLFFHTKYKYMVQRKDITQFQDTFGAITIMYNTITTHQIRQRGQCDCDSLSTPLARVLDASLPVLVSITCMKSSE